MNREQYLQVLEHELRKLDAAERDDILLDFQEHFDAGLDQGKSEEDIAKALGSPKQVAKELLADAYLNKAESKLTTGNVLKAIWAAIGLSFFNLTLILGPFIAFAGLIFGAWLAGIGFAATPLLVLFELIFYPESFAWFELFAALALCGIGILIIIGMIKATRVCFSGFIKYIRFNIKLVKGGMKDE